MAILVPHAGPVLRFGRTQLPTCLTLYVLSFPQVPSPWLHRSALPLFKGGKPIPACSQVQSPQGLAPSRWPVNSAAGVKLSQRIHGPGPTPEPGPGPLGAAWAFCPHHPPSLSPSPARTYSSIPLFSSKLKSPFLRELSLTSQGSHLPQCRTTCIWGCLFNAHYLPVVFPSLVPAYRTPTAVPQS